jgi:glycosyltransferase involved in cell wall biosynthesis
MRLLFTADPELPVPPPLYGGIERIVDSLIRELQKRGHQTALVAHRDSTSPVHAFFPWPFVTHARGLPNLKQNARLWSAAREWKADVVHSFSRLAYLLPIVLSGIPALMSYQRHTGGARHRWMSRLGGQRLQFSGCSEFIAQQGRPWGGSWSAIPNFIDPVQFTFQAQVPADAPLVFLSRIERIKGAHTAIAIARASGRRLILAGNRVDTQEGQAYWRAEIEPHLDDDTVTWIGPVNDVQKNQLLGAAAAMLVPIEWDEPFGIVFAEALACGTPVISCPRGALPEIVRNGVEGFLVQDIAEGAAAIANLSAISRAACRARVEQLFTVERVTTQYEQLYASLAAAAP